MQVFSGLYFRCSSLALWLPFHYNMYESENARVAQIKESIPMEKIKMTTPLVEMDGDEMT